MFQLVFQHITLTIVVYWRKPGMTDSDVTAQCLVYQKCLSYTAATINGHKLCSIALIEV